MTFNPPTLPRKRSDAAAIQALSRGTANDGQQRLALKCIIEELCGTYDMTYDPEGHTAFNEGRRSVGRALVGTIQTSLASIVDAEKRLKAKGRKPRKG